MEENKEVKEINEEELLKKVEKAAQKGARKANFKQILISALPTLIAIGLLAYIIIPKVEMLNSKFNTVFHIDDSIVGRDQTIDNDGVFGYTAADFEEAILGDSSKLKKLEVYKQEVSDVAQIIDTGLLNWGVFTKNQLITYNGTAVYTVDLSTIRKGDIVVDDENKVITLRIPHAVQEEINIPEDQIQFGDTTKGLLAFGDIKMTMEQAADVQREARTRMQQKLDDEKVLETADRFAKLSVWEIYSPLIKAVAKNYSLEVQFR